MSPMDGKNPGRSTIVKLVAVALLTAGVTFVVGLYFIAPYFQRGAETYMPVALAEMPAALITVTNPDDTSTMLLVRLANTAAARTEGLRQVGPVALATTVLLYDQTREVTAANTTYQMSGLRASLELAVIQVNGTVSSLQRVAQDATSAVVAGRHRWVLAAREGLLASMGIVVGSQLQVDRIRRLN